MNQTQAVNQLLAKIRQRRVSSIEEPLNQDARTALEVLGRTSTQVQLHGWSFNTDREFYLPRNEDNEIVLPADTLMVVVSERHRYQSMLPHERNGKLYDPVKRSYTFTNDILVDRLVVEVPFDELPVIAQQFITAAAAVEMIHTSFGDSDAYRVAQREEGNMGREMNRLYANTKKVNFLQGPDTRALGYRRRITRS